MLTTSCFTCQHNDTLLKDYISDCPYNNYTCTYTCTYEYQVSHQMCAALLLKVHPLCLALSILYINIHVHVHACTVNFAKIEEF